MKAHYINILLFALPLNILVNTNKNPSITTHHTQTNRSLCECDLYIPNYDNDPKMKEVMLQFEDRTTQRLREYDERMIEKRMQCKDRCDKEIQKIILKDKLEKQMAQQLTTLDPNITTEDIPTCVCEKSIADKMEKGCLRCGGICGSALPELGSIGGTALYVLKQWKTGAFLAATEEAITEGIAAGQAAGEAAGVAKVIQLVKSIFGITTVRSKALESVFTANNYTVSPTITESVYSQYLATCSKSVDHADSLLCFFGSSGGSKLDASLAYTRIGGNARSIVAEAKGAAEAIKTEVTSAITAKLTTEKTGEIAATYMGYQSTIIASIVAIVVIVLIMVIIYLILRYRRKKKMKKKLQNIKLLEE
ncbi:rifin [Plasmodium reichenowi]|uniref:Rifin n=1 Tax=Plasmodium reichenowi TaxID=5854 RepID=A0A060RLT8_PLARE|nr:rifin [Plasmodium reichenowi]